MSGLSYRVIRSKRKTVALEVSLNGAVTVRCPLKCSDGEIEKFVESHRGWILKTLEKQRIRANNRPKEPTAEEINILKKRAKEYIPVRVNYFEGLTGLKAESVKITSAKARFGSCGPKNNICFSYRLMLYPCDAVDYVIVHELCHTAEHNHGPNFWALVQSIMPDYKKRRNLLKY